MKKVKVAIVGFGHLGRWHVQKAEALETAELVGIVEPTPMGQDRARSAHPNTSVFKSVEEVMDLVDAFVIVTPTSFHFEIAEKCIKAGKHVFIEKPMTSTSEQALKLKEALGSQNKVVQVGHSERFHKVWDYRKEHPEFFEGKSTIRINRVAPFKGRATDVDVVQDLMIHDLDLLLFLMGEVPTHVESTGYKMRTDKWDHVSSDFTFSSGKRANITVGRNHIKEMRDVEISCEHGCLFFDLFANKMIFADAKAQTEETYVVETPYDARDHLYIEQDHFYNSILENTPAIVDIDAGIKAVTLIDKVLESLDKDTKVAI